MVEEYIDANDYENDSIEDNTEDQMEMQHDLAEDVTPTVKGKYDLYSLFWKIIERSDSSKVGNLSKEELGMLDISVRDMQRIALLSRQLNHIGFAEFFEKQAEIVLATSSSKDGWLPELFVSQRKFTTKSRKYNIQNLQPQQKKKGLFK